MGWWIALAYFGMTLVSTRLISNHYIRQTLKKMEYCRAKKEDSYYSYHDSYCNCQRDRPMIVFTSWAASLLWPVMLPLFGVMKTPTKEERAQLKIKRQIELERAKLQRDREIEALRKEYNL